ncbi:HAD family hydrolase, partial [Thioclava sp. BHET1]
MARTSAPCDPPPNPQAEACFPFGRILLTEGFVMPAVIFDLDGTLVDSAPDLLRAVNVMLSALGAAELDLPTLTGFIGNGVPVLLQRVAKARDLDTAPAEMLRLFNAEYDERPVVFTRLYPGVAPLLAQCRAAGIEIALCTNKSTAPARGILRHFGIAEHFSHIVGGDTLAVRKPDPAPLTYAR